MTSEAYSETALYTQLAYCVATSTALILQHFKRAMTCAPANEAAVAPSAH